MNKYVSLQNKTKTVKFINSWALSNFVYQYFTNTIVLVVDLTKAMIIDHTLD